MTITSRVTLWISRNRREVALAAVIAVVSMVALVATHRWWEEIESFLQQTNPYVFFALVCTLPLGGVSITLVYVVVGARFGGPTGMALIAAATAVHLAVTHLIAQSFLRRPVQRWLRRRGYRLPQIAQSEPVALALLGALVPGPPYIVRNYLLALSGVPFRIYFLIAWPVYVIRSGVAIVLGDWAGELSVTRIVILASILLLKLSICALVVRHLYRKHGGSRSARAKVGRQPRTA